MFFNALFTHKNLIYSVPSPFRAAAMSLMLTALLVTPACLPLTKTARAMAHVGLLMCRLCRMHLSLYSFPINAVIIGLSIMNTATLWVTGNITIQNAGQINCNLSGAGTTLVVSNSFSVNNWGGTQTVARLRRLRCRPRTSRRRSVRQPHNPHLRLAQRDHARATQRMGYARVQHGHRKTIVRGGLNFYFANFSAQA